MKRLFVFLLLFTVLTGICAAEDDEYIMQAALFFQCPENRCDMEMETVPVDDAFTMNLPVGRQECLIAYEEGISTICSFGYVDRHEHRICLCVTKPTGYDGSLYDMKADMADYCGFTITMYDRNELCLVASAAEYNLVAAFEADNGEIYCVCVYMDESGFYCSDVAGLISTILYSIDAIGNVCVEQNMMTA